MTHDPSATETTEERRHPANRPVSEHPAENVAPPSNPETEHEDVEKGKEKLGRLSTH
jgi:hypothetical protein